MPYTLGEIVVVLWLIISKSAKTIPKGYIFPVLRVQISPQ